MQHLLGTTKTCPGCEKPFQAYLGGTYGSICPSCRIDLGIRNEKDAEMLVDLLTDCDPVNRAAFLVQAKDAHGSGQGRPAGSQPPPPPPLDPAILAAAIRSAVAYGITTPLPSTLDKSTTYVIAKNGLFEIRETDVARITVASPPTVIGLTEELKAGVTLHIPRLPFSILAQTVAFFREVCVRHQGTSEALVRIWWNRPEARYEVRVPAQRVGGASVDHEDRTDLTPEVDADGRQIWLHVADIHSHGSRMDAFWSGTDDADEKKAPEGRIFGVIGHVDRPIPTWRWRMRAREGFITLGVSDVFEPSAEKLPFTVDVQTLLDVCGTADGVDANGRVRLFYPFDPFREATCPPEWHAQIRQDHTGGRGWGRGVVNEHGFYYPRGLPASTPKRDLTYSTFIYIRAANGRLEEFEVAEGEDRTRLEATGQYLDMSTGVPNGD